MLKTLLIALALTSLLAAQEQGRQKIQTTSTQRLDFPPGGALHLKKSAGELTVEGWNQPAVEITAAKSTRYFFGLNERDKASKELDRVQITAERRGDEILVTTAARHCTSVDVDYRIRAPYSARLIVEHGNGEVHVLNVTGDSRITVGKGGITMDLPEGSYAIDARSSIGGVVSDFAGAEKRVRLTGHRFSGEPGGSAHNLYLRAGFGDILLIKVPKGLGPAE